MASLAMVFNILAKDNASKAFKDVGRAAADAGKHAAGFGKSTGGGMALASKAVAAGASGVVAGIGLSIKKAMDFDKTMRTVGATLGASGGVQKDLSSLALKLGKETVFSAADASDAMLELAKGGMTAAQIKAGALSSTLTLASAGGLEMGNAAGYMVKALTTFGLKASDSSKVAAALAGGANASTSSVEDLGLALSQVGPGAKLAGLSLQDTTAALALFSDNGVRGQDAGTSLKQMLVGLVPTTDKAMHSFIDLGLMTFDAAKGMQVLRDNGVKPLGSDTNTLQGQMEKLAAKLSGAKENSAKAQKEYLKLATSTGALSNQFFDAQGNMKSMADVADILQKALAGQSREQKIATLNTIFGSDASRAAAILTASGTKGLAKYVKATNDQTAAQRMAKTATEGASGAWEAFQGSIETIAITLGVKLLPLFTVLVKKANDVAGVLIDNMEPAFKVVVRVLQTTGKWISDNSTLLGSLSVSIGVLIGAWKAYKLYLTIVAAATKAYAAVQVILNTVLEANPIGIIIVAVAALAGGLIYAYKTSATFRNLVNLAFQKVKDAALNLAGVAIGAFQKLLNFWFIVVGGILDGAATAFGWVPGVGPKLQGAAREFGKFRDSANAKMDAIQKSIQLSVNAKPANAAMTAFYKKWTGKTLQIRANAYADVGNFRGGGGMGGAVARPVNAAIGTGWNGYPGHKGVDFPVPVGTPVRAAMTGTVVRAGWDPGGFGNHIRTVDSDGNMTIYGHLSRLVAGLGQRIVRGLLVAYSGNTGHSTGPHLHLERRHSPFGPNNAFNFTSQLGGFSSAAANRLRQPFVADAGVTLAPGINVVHNKLGRPEPLARTDVPTRMHPHDIQALADAMSRTRPVATIGRDQLMRQLVVGLPA